MSKDDFQLKDNTQSSDGRSEAETRLNTEALQSLNDDSWRGSENSSANSGLELPNLTIGNDGFVQGDNPGDIRAQIEGSKEAVEEAADLGAAVKSGDAQDIQNVLAGVKTPEDYQQLQQSVEELNKNAPDGTKYKVSKDNDGNPVFRAVSKEPIEGANQDEVWSLTVTPDSSEAYHSTFGIVPRTEVEPDEALNAIQGKDDHSPWR